MTKPENQTHTDLSRRRFLTNASLGIAGAAALAEIPFVHAAESPAEIEIKIGLIGCGGRGTGAVLDAIGAATKVIYPASGYHTEDVAEGARAEKKNIKVAALADVFEDRLAPAGLSWPSSASTCRRSGASSALKRTRNCSHCRK